MTDPTNRKIQDILTKTGGQSKLAEQAVYTLIERDHKFLLALVEPYLSGIVAHAIERARKQTGISDPTTAAVSKKAVAKPMTKSATKAKPTTAAMTSGSIDGLLKAWAKKFEDTEPEKKPGATKVSQKHVDAMNALVKKKV